VDASDLVHGTDEPQEICEIRTRHKERKEAAIRTTYQSTVRVKKVRVRFILFTELRTERLVRVLFPFKGLTVFPTHPALEQKGLCRALGSRVFRVICVGLWASTYKQKNS
jgi:hypothetical protein